MCDLFGGGNDDKFEFTLPAAPSADDPSVQDAERAARQRRAGAVGRAKTVFSDLGIETDEIRASTAKTVLGG
jgi:hypothetical protein